MAAALLGVTLSFGVMVPLFYDDIQTQDPAEKAKFIVSLFLDGLRQENN
jgi:hypothetical protein